jgi:hypothetical protein
MPGVWVDVDVAGALSALAVHRPVFHSERDFQHALAWQIQLAQPQAQVRLETRPRRGVHLDLLIALDGIRTAIEVKYLMDDSSWGPPSERSPARALSGHITPTPGWPHLALQHPQQRKTTQPVTTIMPGQPSRPRS